VVAAHGLAQRREVLAFVGLLVKERIVKDATYTPYWGGRLKAVGIATSEVVVGSEVSLKEQVALKCAEENFKNKIPSTHFGYDFSMRPDIVSSMNRMIGFGAVAFDYNQNPVGIHLQGVNKRSEDFCYDRVSELAFLAADLYLTKQLRGGEFIETATLQLQRTLYELKGKKRKVEKKAEYKSRWQQRSPDEREVLMGISGMAVMRGFRADTVKTSNGSGKSAFGKVLDTGKGMSRVTTI